MRLMQFRLKIRLPSTRSLKALDDGVRVPSPESLHQAKTASLKPIRSSTSCCTSFNVPIFCSEKKSRSSVSCRNEEKRSRETLPLCNHKSSCTCFTGLKAYSAHHRIRKLLELSTALSKNFFNHRLLVCSTDEMKGTLSTPVVR